MAGQLTSDQRSRVAEKIMEWGNLVFVGSVIAQVVPGGLFDFRAAFFGVLGLVGAYFAASRMMRGGGG